MWRSFVLNMPVMIIIESLTWLLMPHLKQGQPLTQEQFQQFFDNGLMIWAPWLVLSMALQIQALKWTLNTFFRDLSSL